MNPITRIILVLISIVITTLLIDIYFIKSRPPFEFLYKFFCLSISVAILYKILKNDNGSNLT